MRLYLTGFMGSGKSAVGRILAANLGWQFIDLDQEIERRIAKSIPEIFQQFGEDQFRHWETESLHALQNDPAVIATGGGCFIYNQDWMLANGSVVYLHVPLNELAERIGADASRPLWRNAESLFAEREKHYRKAHYIIDAIDDPAIIASKIIEAVEIR